VYEWYLRLTENVKANASIIFDSNSIELALKILGKTRLSSWYVTPFLDDWLLYLSWVGSGSGTSFSWDINTFF